MSTSMDEREYFYYTIQTLQRREPNTTIEFPKYSVFPHSLYSHPKLRAPSLHQVSLIISYISVHGLHDFTTPICHKLLVTRKKWLQYCCYFCRWALIKDKDVYETMSNYMSLNVDGVSRDTQLRAFKLLKVVTRGRGREIFEFGYKTMKDRWEKLNRALLMSRRFSVQESSPQYCTFSGKVKRPSPGDFSFSSRIKTF